MRARTLGDIPADESQRLWFFESLDRVHRALHRDDDLEEALPAALDVMLEIFECDRVWLSTPCDLESPSYRVVMERTRAAWPGAFAAGVDVPASPDLRAIQRLLLDREEPISLGPESEHPLPHEAQALGVRAATVMRIDPRIEKPYLLGVHRCELARPLSADEVRLFQVIGQRIGDVLGTALVMRALRDHERKLERAGKIAQIGYWERDLARGEITFSPQTCAILGIAAAERVQTVEQWRSWFHPRLRSEDRARLDSHLETAIATGAPYELEYPYTTARGSTLVLHARTELVRSEDGRPMRLFGIIQDITARRQTEARLAASEALYREVVDHATDALFVHDAGGQIVDVNRQACEGLGYSREELLGMSPSEFDADATPEFMAHIAEKLGTTGMVVFDAHHRRKDGSTYPVEVRIRRFVLGERELAVALARDITDRQRVEHELRASQERFRELADTIAEVFWVTDPSKNAMLYISPGYERIWGRTCQSLYESPRSWLDAIHPDDRAAVLEAASTKQALGTYDEEYRIVRPDGEVRWIRDVAFPVRDAGGVAQRMVGVARDITERRSLQAQLLQSQKMEAIGQLAGGVAHDFNNLLGAILIEAELAQDVPHVPPDAQDALGEILAAARRATALTRQLLLFGRRQVMRTRTHDLNAIVGELAKMLHRIIGEHVQLDLKLAPSELRLVGDAGMLEQVLMNLVVNARDAMPGGGTITIATGEQIFDEPSASRVHGAKAGRYAWLSVTDTGEGIPPELMSRIFEPFFTTKEPGRGTGLGLATAFGIVKEHRGWITVGSTPGHGTTFEIFLPIDEQPGDSSDAALPSPKGGSEVIFFVEDEAQLRRGTRKLLERHGYQVIEAESGAAALQLWPRIRESVSLLLTDIVMPGGVDGYELASRLCTDRPELAVILASGYNSEELSRRVDATRRERVLPKPVPSALLLDAIRNALDRRA